MITPRRNVPMPAAQLELPFPNAGLCEVVAIHRPNPHILDHMDDVQEFIQEYAACTLAVVAIGAVYSGFSGYQDSFQLAGACWPRRDIPHLARAGQANPASYTWTHGTQESHHRSQDRVRAGSSHVQP